MMRDNSPVAIDYESLRHPAHTVGFADLVFRVEQNLEMIAVLFHVRHHRRFPLGVLTDREHDEILVALELVVQRLHRGHFFATWPAPGRPYIQKNHLTLERGERDGFAGEGIFELEVAGDIAGRHRGRGIAAAIVGGFWYQRDR